MKKRGWIGILCAGLLFGQSAKNVAYADEITHTEVWQQEAGNQDPLMIEETQTPLLPEETQEAFPVEETDMQIEGQTEGQTDRISDVVEAMEIPQSTESMTQPESFVESRNDILQDMVAQTANGEALNWGFTSLAQEASEMMGAYASAVTEPGEIAGPGQASVTAAIVGKTIDGTALWDENDLPGNDSSDQNGRVRSFDQVSYTLAYTMGINSMEYSSFTQGDVWVSFVLPGVTQNEADFDIEAMKWLLDQQITQTEEGLQLTGRRHVENGDFPNAIPGAGTLSVIVQMKGMANNSQLTPVFRLWMQDTSLQECSSSPITISAAPSMNVYLSEADFTSEDLYFSLLDGGIAGEKQEGYQKGRVSRFGILLEMRNSNPNKGWKGLEIPSGPITFSLGVKGYYSPEAVPEQLSEWKTPQLWDYQINMPESTGCLGRDITAGGYGDRYVNTLPYGRYEENTQSRNNNACFGSGNWQMTQNEEEILVTVSDYQFCFPFYGSYLGPWDMLPDQDGRYAVCFSCGYVELFQEIPEQVQVPTDFYTGIQEKQLQMTSVSGQRLADSDSNTNQVIQTDDERMVMKHVRPSGSVGKFHSIDGVDNSETFGTGQVEKGRILPIGAKIQMKDWSSIHSLDFLVKFDDACFDPGVRADGIIDSTNGYAYDEAHWGDCYIWDGENYYNEYTDLDYTLVYAAKPDKSGWNSDLEMDQTKRDGLVYYPTAESLANSGAVCVGYLIQARGNIGDSCVYTQTNAVYGVTIWISLNMKVKESVQAGGVYQVVSDIYGWREEVPDYADTGYSQLGIRSLSDAVISLENGTNPAYPYYIKSQYNEAGAIIEGTNNNGGHSGNCVRIVDTCVKIAKMVAQQTEDGKPKKNFDMSFGQNQIDWILLPQMQDPPDGGTQVSVVDTVPANLEVQENSFLFNGSYQADGSLTDGQLTWKETAAKPKIETQQDGSTKLTWYFGQAMRSDLLPVIHYRTQISNRVKDGETYKNQVTIDCAEDTRDIRQSTGKLAVSSINIIRQLAVSLTKTLEEEDRQIEPEGAIDYQITASNISEDQAVNRMVLMDVLPFEGDGRGSQYHGSIQIQSQTAEGNWENGLLIAPVDGVIQDQWIVYYTDSPEAQQRNADTLDVTGWKSAAAIRQTDGSVLYAMEGSVTAWAVLGTLPQQSALSVSYRLQTSGNQNGDCYVNDVTMMGNGLAKQVESALVTSKVIGSPQEADPCSLWIRKQIPAQEIFWSHGNPVFTYCISRLTEEGERIIVGYRVLEFTRADSGQEKLYQEVLVEGLIPGIYEVEELETYRYECVGERLLTQRIETGSAEFSFENRVTAEYGESDTTLARNVVDLSQNLIYRQEVAEGETNLD